MLSHRPHAPSRTTEHTAWSQSIRHARRARAGAAARLSAANSRPHARSATRPAVRGRPHKEIRRMRRGLVIPFVIAAGTAAVAAPAGFTVQDLVAMDRLSELASSSAHQRLAFTVSTLDREANRRRTDIWTVDAKDGRAPVRLTADPASDTSPVWSADGQTIFFLSSRSGSSQVWRMPGAHAGEATQVTKLPARRRRLRAVAGRQAARGRARGLPRLRRPGVHGRPRRRGGEAQGHRPPLRQAVLPPLGHVEGWPALAPLRGAVDTSTRRRTPPRRST